MTGLTEVFGGSTVQPSSVAYSAVSLSATIQTQWPPFATGTSQPLARLMDVAASSAGLSIKLPDATLAGKGQDVFFNNTGSNSYSVTDIGGNVIATIAAGQQRYLYLTNNTTPNGSWRSMLFGVGSSSPDASQLAGYGVKAIGATLNQVSATQTLAANYSFSASDRAGMFVNTGGSITGTLPLTSSVGSDFFIEVRNQGSGIFTFTPSGGELIDGAVNIALQLNESCAIHSGTGAWYTVGRGRNTQFNFTQLVKPLTGGTTTLSLTEASNVVQTYNGTASSNNILVLPSVVQVYYITNNILGGYTLLMKTSGVGATLGLAYGQSAVVFCDGLNVINASTSIGGITALLLAAGSVSAPSLAVSTSNNGLFAPTGSTLAVTAGGVEAIRWSGAQTLAPSGTVSLPPYSFIVSPSSGLYSGAVNTVSLAVSGVQTELNTSTSKTVYVPVTVQATNAQITSQGTGGFGSFYAKSSGTNSSYMFFGDAGGERGRITSQTDGSLTFSRGNGATTSGGFDSSGNFSLTTGVFSGLGTNLTGTAASLTAGNATTATTASACSGNSATATLANHIAGGAGGQVHYQSANNTTALLANGTSGQVLQSNGGTSAPSWVTLTAIPAGAVIHTAMSTAPTGFLKANGAVISRTTYATLFAAIGTTFGAGDGSTTFSLPDLRGEFIRGWDDARGADSGRGFGSWQPDELKSHTHTFGWGSNNAAGAYLSNYVTTNAGPQTTDATGGSETRPRNVALLACIKY